MRASWSSRLAIGLLASWLSGWLAGWAGLPVRCSSSFCCFNSAPFNSLFSFRLRCLSLSLSFFSFPLIHHSSSTFFVFPFVRVCSSLSGRLTVPLAALCTSSCVETKKEKKEKKKNGHVNYQRRTMPPSGRGTRILRPSVARSLEARGDDSGRRYLETFLFFLFFFLFFFFFFSFFFLFRSDR